MLQPYSGEFGPILSRYDNTEEGIAQAHGHAEQFAERMGIPKEAAQVGRYTSTTGEPTVVPAPTAKKTVKTAVPKKDEVVITKGGKSVTKKLGGN